MVPETFEDDAIRFEDVEALELIQRSRGLQVQYHVDIDDLAAQGKLRFLRFLVKNVSVSCTTKAMAAAAAQGRLDVVRLLHETRSEGCTTAAMDSAAAGRHWDVVAFLDEHRHEGCTYTLLRPVVRLGRLDLVQRYFLPEELRTAPLLAGGYGFAEVQRFLANVASPEA